MIAAVVFVVVLLAFVAVMIGLYYFAGQIERTVKVLPDE